MEAEILKSSEMLVLADELVVAADQERWDEVSRIQGQIQRNLEVPLAISAYSRSMLEKIQSAVETAKSFALGRRHEIDRLVTILAK